MSSGGSAVRAGCGAFGLVGVLVAVGLTVWLGARALDGEGGAAARRAAPTTTEPAASVPRLAVTAEPTTGLTDGRRVVVTGRGLTPGATVAVRQCLAGPGAALVVGDGRTCDEDHVVDAVVDPGGRLRAEVPVTRVLAVASLPFDCAEDPGTCALEVSAADGPARSAPIPLGFAAAGPPELTLPD